MRDKRTNKAPLGWRESFGALPPLAGKFSGPAIVLGRARGWVDELDAALAATDFAPIFAVNHQQGHYPGLCVDHVVSVHGALFPEKHERRKDTLYHTCKPLHTCGDRPDVFWPIVGAGSGTSALLASLIALHMGFGPVVVAGVHLEEVRATDLGGGRTAVHSYALYQRGWNTFKGELFGKVFSVSPVGTFLRDLLGGPE